MIRVLGFLLIVLAVFGLSWSVVNEKIPGWEAEAKYLMLAASQAGGDTPTWEALSARADKNLPSVYPFSVIHDVLAEGTNVTSLVQDFDLNFSIDWDQNAIPTDQIEPLWDLLDELEQSLSTVISKVLSIPRWALSADQKRTRDNELAQLEIWQRQLRDVQQLKNVWKDFQKKEERVLILLQNRNEPRPTGGFVGSLVLLDFSSVAVRWQFLDIYELDRLLTETDQIPAPVWFHDLSKTISLRDANFYPDFIQSADQYRDFFAAIDQKPPTTIVGINLSVIEALMQFTGPVQIEPWGVELNQYNFDLVLQFLVESKISGRFAVKEPILQFAQKLLSPEQLSNLDIGAIRAFDWGSFGAQKNILAHSENKTLQKLFRKWRMDGEIKRTIESDNFLQFDFVSIGANKSDKFIWTKLWHDSAIDRRGTIINTLDIKRTHALVDREIDNLLGTGDWSTNVRDLLTPDLRWKLGAGENRVILRVSVPKEAQLLSQKNLSGFITSTLSADETFKIWEIPLNVVPGETLNAELVYETQIRRGSQRWRPYNLQLVGTPARTKTDFISTITTIDGGKFSAQSTNIGRPQDLIDQEFRAVIEFQ